MMMSVTYITFKCWILNWKIIMLRRNAQIWQSGHIVYEWIDFKCGLWIHIDGSYMYVVSNFGCSLISTSCFVKLTFSLYGLIEKIFIKNSAPKGWMDFKFRVRLSFIWTYVVNNFGCSLITTSCRNGGYAWQHTKLHHFINTICIAVLIFSCCICRFDIY